MKNQLINILNGLNMIEVKGQSVMILGDCMTQLANVVNQLEQMEQEVNKGQVPKIQTTELEDE